MSDEKDSIKQRASDGLLDLRGINNCAANTDKELWRETPDDAYAPSVHVTQNNQIGINIGGRVVVLDIHTWHWLGEYYCKVIPALPQR